ncbi:DeoR/GlpR family DNA-binding transcription regulator [Streptomyces sp. MP131-18]|uniref:DeoR/GlpR family DNA-binding transcription regulator n=1 Tax=Streptomyces sp. MP131-18 TaxID=1857892 RepID=UPI00097C836E|nr:DeoR/GlpR family DNA-binding transcription regulator [Streptomyces sp. MP131-18]ONK09639.1 Glycerol-3-phosphate regulon repressor [Streptomyces sp. MP131-18]
MGKSGRTRRDVILRMLDERERLEVAELTRRLGVSAMTVRRDLHELQQDGVLRRVHGGAVRRERSPFETRRVAHAEEKLRIAARAAGLVDDGDSVAIDTGTTAHSVARALRGRRDLVVVTNSIHVAGEFQGAPDSSAKVLLAGGVIAPELCLVGSLATETIRKLHVNKLVLGCGGLTAERGLTFFDIEEAEVRRAMLEIAEKVIVVMDHTKFGRTETISVARLDQVDVLVTDAEPPPPYARLCRDSGVELVIA